MRDPVGAAADEVVRATGARKASSEEIIAAPDIDAVIIATPTDAHTAAIEAAVRAGKAIYCEKPIDLDPERGEPASKSSTEPGHG